MSLISTVVFFPHCFGLYSCWTLPLILFLDLFSEGSGVVVLEFPSKQLRRDVRGWELDYIDLASLRDSFEG